MRSAMSSRMSPRNPERIDAEAMMIEGKMKPTN